MWLKSSLQMTIPAYLPLKSTNKITENMKQQFSRHLTSARGHWLLGNTKENCRVPFKYLACEETIGGKGKKVERIRDNHVWYLHRSRNRIYLFPPIKMEKKIMIHGAVSRVHRKTIPQWWKNINSRLSMAPVPPNKSWKHSLGSNCF